jgi:hypothetical protein
MAHHVSIETCNDGTYAYRVDEGGEWKFFRTAVCVDHGGNIYERRTAPAGTTGLLRARPRGVACKVSYRDEVNLLSGAAKTATTITADTTRDEITVHLDAAGVSYDTDQRDEDDSVRVGSLFVFRHGANEGDGVANLWGWYDQQCSGGLDSLEELDKLVADAIKIGERVIAGRGGPDEDTGIVHGFDGRMADVAFDSGVRVNVPVYDIERA